MRTGYFAVFIAFVLLALPVGAVAGFPVGPGTGDMVGADGAPQDALLSVASESKPRFEVTEGEGRETRPDVAGHPELGDCQNLVVWFDETEKAIRGRFVELEWRGDPFTISGEVGAAGRPRVAYNAKAKAWLVVWSSPTEGGRAAIRGRYVVCGKVDGAVFTIGAPEGDGAPEDTEPAVAATGETFAVVWRRELEGGGTAIVGGHVVDGTTRFVKFMTDNGVVSEPAIACEARGDCLVAWTRELEENRDVLGRYWFPREDMIGEGLLEIAVTSHAEFYPSVAWSGYYDRHGYAVTWTLHGPERRTVQARSVYPMDPSKLGTYEVGKPVLDVGLEGHVGGQGDVAAQGQGFVVVWSAGEEKLEHIVARCLGYEPATRALVLGEIAWVSDHVQVETYPAVGAATQPYALTVWQIEREANGSDILGRHMALACAGEKRRVALVGVLAGEGVAVAESGQWTLTVRTVIYGDYSCATAIVTGPDVDMTPALRVGDVVIVRADPAAGGDPCALEIGAADTVLDRAEGYQGFLPHTFDAF